MPYRFDLKAARRSARAEFLAQSPFHGQLIEKIEQLVPDAIDSVSKTCKLSRYQQVLLASFCRTNAVASELIQNSELIEAVALNRKQLELLARLRELDQVDPKKLLGKVPNVARLRSKIRKIYSGYSESVHSSTYAAHSLLGILDGRKRIRSLLFPEFMENTEIIFANWVQIFFEFTLWTMELKQAQIPGYDRKTDHAIFSPVMVLFRQFESVAKAHLGRPL